MSLWVKLRQIKILFIQRGRQVRVTKVRVGSPSKGRGSPSKGRFFFEKNFSLQVRVGKRQVRVGFLTKIGKFPSKGSFFLRKKLSTRFVGIFFYFEETTNFVG